MKNLLNVSNNSIYVKVFIDGGLSSFNLDNSISSRYLFTIKKSILNDSLKVLNQRKKTASESILSKKLYFRY